MMAMKYKVATASAMVASIALVAMMLAGNASARVDCRLGDSHTWSHLGGDPVWKGGINSVNQLGIVVKSAAGQRSLTCLGLNEAERKAVTSNVSKAKPCTLQYRQRLIAMAFHSDGASVDRPTRFVDPRYKNSGAPSYCLTVKVKAGKSTAVIELIWPKECVNAALVSLNTSTREKTRPPKKAPTIIVKGNCNIVVVGNNNKVTNNRVCTYQATYTIVVICSGVQINKSFNGKGSTSKKAKAAAKKKADAWLKQNSNNCNTVPAPQPPPPAPQPPPPPGPPSPPPPGPPPPPPPPPAPQPPPPPVNKKPKVEITNPPAHVCPGGTVVLFTSASDPDGDPLTYSWSADGGSIVSGQGTPSATFKAQNSPGTGSVTVTVYDGKLPVKDHTDSATVTFPIPSPSPSQCNF